MYIKHTERREEFCIAYAIFGGLFLEYPGVTNVCEWWTILSTLGATARWAKILFLLFCTIEAAHHYHNVCFSLTIRYLMYEAQ